jgi:hypothetical protein
VSRDAPFERHISLVRHARSAHLHAGWVDAAGFQAWREAYEAAGVAAGEQVPAEMARLVAMADLIVASDAPRAVGSARLLVQQREPLVSPLLRELDLEGPSLGGASLPLLGWAVAVGMRSLLLGLRGRYPSVDERTRIEAAAGWLEELTLAHPRLVAITHASFRRRLWNRLVELGWRAEPGPRTLRHWSTWRLRGPGGG